MGGNRGGKPILWKSSKWVRLVDFECQPLESWLFFYLDPNIDDWRQLEIHKYLSKLNWSLFFYYSIHLISCKHLPCLFWNIRPILFLYFLFFSFLLEFFPFMDMALVRVFCSFLSHIAAFIWSWRHAWITKHLFWKHSGVLSHVLLHCL